MDWKGKQQKGEDHRKFFVSVFSKEKAVLLIYSRNMI